MGATPVTDAEWQDEVLTGSNEKPVLVDFWAPWCGPCRQVSPIVDQIADEQAGLKVVKINIDENPEAPRTYGVMSIPTLLVFKDGEPAKRIVGNKPKAKLLSDLADFVS